mgnify:CR=1 FL=1
MYARFLAARHGLAAGRLARKTADSLQAKGDFEGYAIWARVADATERGPAKSAPVWKASWPCRELAFSWHAFLYLIPFSRPRLAHPLRAFFLSAIGT